MKKTKATRRPNRFPKGWDEKRVKALISHYDNQSEEGAVAEDEAAYHDAKTTMVAVPVELIPAVRKLISKRAG